MSLDITRLLRRWSSGDRAAEDELVPIVYDQLRRMARSFLKSERSGHTLQPTEVVHEVYLRICEKHDLAWQSRACFFAFAAEVMRHFLVDHARRRRAAKRGGPRFRVTLDLGMAGPTRDPVDVIALDEALSCLQELDPRQSRIVELRYFAGLSIDEVAAILEVSPATVKADWDMARAWLRRRLRRLPAEAAPAV